MKYFTQYTHLLHPRAIVGFLEKSEKLEVGIAEMAVELGTSAVFGDARCLVPRSRVAVEELVLSDAFAAVIEVDILSLV